MAKSTSKLFQNEEANEMKEDAMNLPEKEENAVVDSIANDVQDINLSAIRKKRFRINGDNNKILELNTSDLNFLARLESAYERLIKSIESVGKIVSESEEELTDANSVVLLDKLKEIDKDMRKEVDYIFDAPVSDICCDNGSMYDPFEGMFRFEHIIDALSKLYGDNINAEFNKMRRRVSAKTSKYTKKYHN